MRTSMQVYQQIRWDARFDEARFFVLIDVHRTELQRAPLVAYVPGGDIPWHRIIAIEADGEIVWDRRSGIDRLGQSRAGFARATHLLRPPFFSQRSPVRFDPLRSSWVSHVTVDVAAIPRPSPPPAALRVVTWNTLWDRFEADRISTAIRRPLLLEALRKTNADVIALQEVERPLLDMLLHAGWVRAGYAVSMGDEEGAAAEERDGHARPPLPPGGLLLLSKLPMTEVATHALGPHKAVVAISIRAGGGHSLIVANVHLTSDHSEGGAHRRTIELDELALGLGSIDSNAVVVVVGDFNDGGVEPASRLRMRDAWLEAKGESDATPTFDPTTNSLAAISSLSGMASRLDRVLVRGAKDVLQTKDVFLEGTERDPVTGLFASDHYGVRVDFVLLDDSAATKASTPRSVAFVVVDQPPTHRTALAWLPPDELWPSIQAIRAKHDPSFARWPPHVNVLYGFVPESSFDDAARAIAHALAGVSPFDVVLEGVETFEHGERDGNTTLWLDPAPAAAGPQTKAWSNLYDVLVEGSFPRQKASRAFRAHLTIGKGSGGGDREAWSAALGRQTSSVRELCLLSRRGDEPMQIRARVTLGDGCVSWIDPQSAHLAHSRRDPVEAIASQIERAHEGSVVHIAGSHRLECAIDGSDLDLVVVVPGAEVAALRRALPSASAVRLVEDARVCRVEARIGDLDVDISFVASGSVPPEEACARRGELGDANAVALSAVSDADALLEMVQGQRDAFVRLGKTIKAWARARGIDAAAFGGVPSLGWLTLCARSIQDRVEQKSPLDDQKMCARFFESWAGWEWRHPVSTAAPISDTESFGDAMCILTPTSPIRSCTRQVTRAMRDQIVEELFRGWEICDAAASSASSNARTYLDDLTTLPPMHRRHDAWAIVTAPSASFGAVRGRMRALITMLETGGIDHAHAWPHPFEEDATHVKLAIGLGRASCDAALLEKLTTAWLAASPVTMASVVSIRLAENGEVPTLSTG